MAVHFRGKVRLGFWRQFSDHSTIMAPYNVLMYLFSAVPNRPILDEQSIPELASAARQLAADPRGGAGAVRAGADQGRRQVQRLGFQLVLPHRMEAVLPEMVRRGAAVGAGQLPEDGRTARIRSRTSRARCSPACRPAASWCSTAIPMPARCAITSGLLVPKSPGECRIFIDGERVLLARGRGPAVRRDLSALCREHHQRRPHHPVLRRRAPAAHPRHDRGQPLGQLATSSTRARPRTRRASASAG